MVTSVPWQLDSSEAAKNRARKRADWNAPGSVRRGPVGPPRQEQAATEVGQRKRTDRPGPSAAERLPRAAGAGRAPARRRP